MPGRIPTFKRRSVPTLQRPRDDSRWRRFINSPSWRKCAKSYLIRNPVCVRCFARGELTEASNVHHTKGQDMEHAFDESTFEALCVSCHSRQTRQDMYEGKGSDDASNQPGRPIGYA